MTIRPQIMTSSHEAVRPAKMPSSGSLIVAASGICTMSMITEVIFRQTSQICGLTTNRKEKTKVRVNSSLGSSASKPTPAIMLRVA